MTAAPPLTSDERARVAAFDAAPDAPESSPLTRAMLALAEELDGEAAEDERWLNSSRVSVGEAQELPSLIRQGRDHAFRIRATVTTVLAADPEPRGEA